MRWTQLIHPKEQLNVSSCYVLGIFDEHLQEVDPLYMIVVLEVSEKAVKAFISGTLINIYLDTDRFYFIHVTKHVENGR